VSGPDTDEKFVMNWVRLQNGEVMNVCDEDFKLRMF
jgi:hypothetical protein